MRGQILTQDLPRKIPGRDLGRSFHRKRSFDADMAYLAGLNSEQREAVQYGRKYHAYAVDLARNVKDLPDYLALMSPALNVWELGCAPAADGENR